jgi:hypothetical protein
LIAYMRRTHKEIASLLHILVWSSLSSVVLSSFFLNDLSHLLPHHIRRRLLVKRLKVSTKIRLLH